MRRKSARAIAASESSSSPSAQGSWQTPRTARGQVTRDNGDPSKERLTTEGQAKNWPTPNVPTRGPEKKEDKRPKSGGEDLLTKVMNWPTPGANDHKGTAKLGQRRGQLDEATEQKFLTTPEQLASLLQDRKSVV